MPKVVEQNQATNPSLRITNFQNSISSKAYKNNNYVKARPLGEPTGKQF